MKHFKLVPTFARLIRLPLTILPFEPADVLKPFIRTFLIIESEEGMENFVLPDTATVLSIRYRGRIYSSFPDGEDILPEICFSGIRKSYRQIRYAPGTGNLLILFHPCGASAFSRGSWHEWLDQSQPAGEIEGFRDLKFWAENLAELPGCRQKIDFLEQQLISSLKNTKTDELILLAVRRLTAERGDLSIRELSRQLHISQDPFEKRFRREVGTGPKHFSSILRMRHAIRIHAVNRTLTDTAHAAGYYDQSHFIRDFKSFTGSKPRDFFRQGRYW